MQHAHPSRSSLPAQAVRTDRRLGDKTPFCQQPDAVGRIVINLYGHAAPGSVATIVAAAKGERGARCLVRMHPVEGFAACDPAFGVTGAAARAARGGTLAPTPVAALPASHPTDPTPLLLCLILLPHSCSRSVRQHVPEQDTARALHRRGGAGPQAQRAGAGEGPVAGGRQTRGCLAGGANQPCGRVDVSGQTDTPTAGPPPVHPSAILAGPRGLAPQPRPAQVCILPAVSPPPRHGVSQPLWWVGWGGAGWGWEGGGIWRGWGKGSSGEGAPRRGRQCE